MKRTASVFLFLTCLIGMSQTRFDVSSQSEFDAAHDAAGIGDSIVWESGTYADVFMDISGSGLVVSASVPGTVIFNGASKVEIEGDNVILSELQFVGGNIGTDHVIGIWGDEVLVTQVNIADYTSYKYLIVDEDSRRTTIGYSNFENRLNLDDQNILSILVDESEPGYHKIQYCSFKNFEGTGNDLGIEPIRIGVSTQAQFNSRTIVEYCYFTNCDGDGELISNKASQNVIRYNTFEDNSKAELVLRHGDEAIVYGNFFLNNMGGVRVREGSNHFIYNNYFEGLQRRSIYLQNEDSDPLSNIFIYFNTIVSAAEMILGGDGSNPPTNVILANNVFADPMEQLFEDPTGNEAWLGNIYNGSLGISAQAGIEELELALELNTEGFYEIGASSAAIDYAVTGYEGIPIFEGLAYDATISLDLMKQERPETIGAKDVGSMEYSENLFVKPHVTEENTGPFYLNDAQTVTVAIQDRVGGDIVLDPPFKEFLVGSVVTATAVPNAGYQFHSWSGTLYGTENPIQFTVLGEMEIGAEFVSAPLNATEEMYFRLYPNPSNDRLIIDFSDTTHGNVSFQIFSISGLLIAAVDGIVIPHQANAFQVDISGLTAGTYVLIGKDDAFRHQATFIKK